MHIHGLVDPLADWRLNDCPELSVCRECHKRAARQIMRALISRPPIFGFGPIDTVIICFSADAGYLLADALRKEATCVVSNFKRLRGALSDSDASYGNVLIEKVNLLHDSDIASEYATLLSGSTVIDFHVALSVAPNKVRCYAPLEEANVLISSPSHILSTFKDDPSLLCSVHKVIIWTSDAAFHQNPVQLLDALALMNRVPKDSACDLSLINVEPPNPSNRSYLVVGSGIRHFEICKMLDLQPSLRVKERTWRPPGFGNSLDILILKEQNCASELKLRVKTHMLERDDCLCLVVLDESQISALQAECGQADLLTIHETMANADLTRARTSIFKKTIKVCAVTQRFLFFRPYFLKHVGVFLFYKIPPLSLSISKLTSFAPNVMILSHNHRLQVFFRDLLEASLTDWYVDKSAGNSRLLFNIPTQRS